MGRKRPEEQWETWEFPLESKLQNFVMDRLAAFEPDKISDRFNAGISDIQVILNGMIVAIELKVRNNQPTKLQQLYMAKVRKHGGVSGCAWNWGQVKAIMNEALQKQGMELI